MNSKEAILNVKKVPEKFDKSGGTILGNTTFNKIATIQTADINTANILNADIDIATFSNVARFNDDIMATEIYMGDVDNTVYHKGRKPTPADIGAATSNHSHTEFNAETRFHRGTYTDPWDGTSCAIKATGNIAATGAIRSNQIQAHANNKTATMGVGGNDVFLTNSAANRYLQLKDNGTLCWSDSEIWHTGNFHPNSTTVENCNKIGGKRITVGGGAPGGAAWGDIWITW